MTHHFRENAAVTPEPKSALSIGFGLATTGLAVVVIVLLYAVAHQWDEVAKANERLAEARANDMFEQSVAEHVWVRRLGQAYAKGRQDALQVDVNSPEAVALANACANISLAARGVH